MSTAITKHGAPVAALTAASWEEAWSVAKKLAEAQGFVPRQYVGNPAAILAAIGMGSELGLGPMQSLRSIHVVEGKPSLSADLMLALAIRAGVRAQWLRTDDKAAHLRLTRDGHEPHEHTFTIEDAQRAKLAGKNVWQSYPAAMLRARCLSGAMRAFCPDVLGAGVYVEGELTDDEPPPPARVVGHDPAGYDLADVEVVEGEAACGDPEPVAEQPVRLAAPDRMSDCRDADELRAWCAIYGARVARAGNGTLTRLVAHAESIGVTGADVRAWCGVEAA